MVDIESRIQKAIEEITGNESLLEMLETEAATEMLEWGKSLVASLVRQTESMDDAAAQEFLDAHLRSVRQFMRSAGNWAAGKYSDPEDRMQLREKLLGHRRVIQGDDGSLPPAEELDTILSQVDDTANTPQQLILNLEQLFSEAA